MKYRMFAAAILGLGGQHRGTAHSSPAPRLANCCPGPFPLNVTGAKAGEKHYPASTAPHRWP